MFSASVLHAAKRLTECCVEQNVRIVFAESCTAGLIAGAMTAIPGSSRVVDRGFVVYSNESKVEELSVPPLLIEQHGAVSEPVVIAMARGALARAATGARLSIAVTGVAGPDATPDKPVGLVHIAAAIEGRDAVRHRECKFGPLGRDDVRMQTVQAALTLALEHLNEK
jgi:nicotinamide-nucleotide amidase